MNIDPSVCARGLPRDPHGRHRLHPLVARAAEALETAGVTWALLRGEHDLGDPRGDVDILVDSSRELGAVEQALRPLGVVAVPQVGAGAHRLFVGYHRPTRRWIEFDVEWDLDFGPQLHFTLNWLAPALRSGAARAVLARRQRSPDLPGMWVLHPDDAFWALLLHVIIDKGTVKDHHADRLVALCAEATPSGPLAQVVADACPPGWDVDRVIGCARARRVAHARRARPGARPAVLHPASRGPSGRGAGPRSAPARPFLVAGAGDAGGERRRRRPGRCGQVRARGRASVRATAAGPARPPPPRGGLPPPARADDRVRRAPRGIRARVDPRPDVVIVLEPRSPVTRDVLADAVDRRVAGPERLHRRGELRTGSRVMRTMPGTSTTATTNCVAR